MAKNQTSKAQKDSNEPYTPERLEVLARCLKHLAVDVDRHAQTMRTGGIDSIELGDAMLRRSYKHIQHFVVAIERAVDRRHSERSGGIPRAPW